VIIDGHCHAGRGDSLTAPWNTDAPLGAYLRRARAAGIDRTVVFAAFHSDYRVANAEVAEIVAADPSLMGFACVHTRSDAGRIGEMVGRAVRDWGFLGIKVHRHQAPLTREVCEAARRWRVPVLYDVAGAAHTLSMIAPQYPDVPFIVPHLGSFSDDWRAHLTVIDVLTRFPNVYADTSGVRRFGYLVQAVRRAGPAKLIFGSDGPWLHPGLELHKIRLLGLGPDDEAAVLGGTLSRLFATGRDRDVTTGARVPRWTR
jgi:predicted TIM-barrel fold metal-dependent hydrolase